MNDFGQLKTAVSPLAHTGAPPSASPVCFHPHLRFSSRPALRQLSHFQPAWLEN
jgi:hypothetical protein